MCVSVVLLPFLSLCRAERLETERKERAGEIGKVMSDGCFVCVCHPQLLNFAFKSVAEMHFSFLPL